jgi:hypothetical protein
MASIGDEKRIRALFSDLKSADEQTAPSFTAVWHRAQSRSLKPQRAFNLSFAVATALLVCAMATLAVWSLRSKPVVFASVSATMSPAPGSFARQPDKSSTVAAAPEPLQYTGPPVRNRLTKSTSLRHAQEIAVNQQLTKEANAITSWQSPTSDLLSSTSDGLFKSLPQLNENANELKSFLPNRENDKEK